MNSAENVSDEELGRFIRRASLKRFSFAQEAYRIAIALQSLRSPPTEDGDRVGEWVLVPREPTREMWAAMGTAVTGYYNKHHDIVAGEVYRAMIAASPRPETVGVSDAMKAALKTAHELSVQVQTGPEPDEALEVLMDLLAALSKDTPDV